MEHRLTLAGGRLRTRGKQRVGREVQEDGRETGVQRGTPRQCQPQLLEVSIVHRHHWRLQLSTTHGSTIQVHSDSSGRRGQVDPMAIFQDFGESWDHIPDG
ncbi:hypothetical protein EYF80_012393 [Liparis tanakae]|uniref:Uncharacterized protein n=1 Tax=Liparis tanakae TaxID=230148 RepID=A0A4Z2IHD4_9TELE|nr:hypothetical protein EYF80_012393 [Liparis tanakae]